MPGTTPPRNDKSFFIKIFIAFIILIPICVFFFLKPKPTPVVDQTQNFSSSGNIIKDKTNSIPLAFPTGIITERGIEAIESFTVKNADGSTQYTYRYFTDLTPDQALTTFSKSPVLKGWQKVGETLKIGNNWSLNLTKDADVLSISYSINTFTSQKSIDITLTTKK